MSRTDKDRPWWVQNFQDGPELYDHDHHNGECIEETLEYAQWAQSRPYRHKNCNKRVRVDFTCRPAKVNGKRSIVFSVEVPESRYSYYPYGYSYANVNRKKICWDLTCDCGHPADDYTGRWNCELKYRTECFGHYYIYFDRDIPCTCDTWPERPTCSRTRAEGTKGGYRRYTWGGVPSDFVRAYYHRPERARERQLKDYVNEYNTYGELEDGDFENRQARNSCRWIYW
jgi:hypothetical protein